ncbi:MAG: DICT sensory domain-containing protein [Xenococcaceae cyanobacterium MO_188.B32]|nr:DICT sensory domain-containing protein [Xenococcaceae cyanobacterium MO_188.B32]
MSSSNSLLQDLLADFPEIRSQIYFKSSLVALARAMEDLVLAGDDVPLVIVNYQQERFFRRDVRRYEKIAQWTDQVYVLAAPEQESDWTVGTNQNYEAIALRASDNLVKERQLVIVGEHYTACLVGYEKSVQDKIETPMEQGARFEGLWSFDRQICQAAANWLLERIMNYRPELEAKIEQAKQLYTLTTKTPAKSFLLTSHSVDLGIFAQRLITYLQAGQYKLLKAYKVIALGARRERLINTITSALRSSLNPQEILQITVRELGKLFPQCRCLLYRLNSQNNEVKIEYEYVGARMPSLLGQKWLVTKNSLFLAAQASNAPLAIDDVQQNNYLQNNSYLQKTIQQAAIRAWLLVPIRYQGRLLGMLELHYGGEETYQWNKGDITLVEAIATQVGVALAQASAYHELIELNSQLEAMERIQSNLIAIVGHELRTPLSTILIFLESLASEPGMPDDLLQIMLDTALGDAERLRQLIQDFLTLSKLETGNPYRRPEPVQLQYVIELALQRIRTIDRDDDLPEIRVELPHQLPSVLADAEGLVEVFTKLLNNACKFTPSEGFININALILSNLEVEVDDLSSSEISHRLPSMLEIIVADTGRGIEPSQLETIFQRFSQEERFLRRSTSGIGLGLAICRRIVNNMGGEIWATSAGKNQGSQFHFTVPIESFSED